MKNNTHNSNLNQDQLSEQQLNELENDAVWTLLNDAEQASPVEASPMFARNVMREIRVSESEPSLWQRIFTPKANRIALTLGATAACATLVITQLSESDQSDAISPTTADVEIIDGLEDLTIDELVIIEEDLLAEADETNEDAFTDEMLELASQDPFFISEEEIEIVMGL